MRNQEKLIDQGTGRAPADMLQNGRRFFEHVSKSDFLMGRTHSHGRRPFDLSLDWLIKSENFAKVLEGEL